MSADEVLTKVRGKEALSDEEITVLTEHMISLSDEEASDLVQEIAGEECHADLMKKLSDSDDLYFKVKRHFDQKSDDSDESEDEESDDE